ncbi:MAG: hypothetical protein HC837_04320 [Chloroflexaceae bacterium]|nr:hypothetical protein [Chloroflexaceae bacterium]
MLGYRSAGGRYWKVFLDHPFDTVSSTNKVAYLDGLTGAQAVALLSSSFFWWYYSTHFDMYNLKDYMVFGFRFSAAKESTLEQLQTLGQQLLSALEAQATLKEVRIQRYGKRISRRYTVSTAKPLIDAIDAVLAQHYGVSTAAYQFIIHYDSKYRMAASRLR